MKKFILIAIFFSYPAFLNAQNKTLLNKFYDTFFYKLDTSFVAETKKSRKIAIMVFRDKYTQNFIPYGFAINNSPLTIVASDAETGVPLYYKKFKENTFLISKNKVGKTFLQLASYNQTGYFTSGLFYISSFDEQIDLENIFNSTNLSYFLYSERLNAFILLNATGKNLIAISESHNYSITLYKYNGLFYEQKSIGKTSFSYPPPVDEISPKNILKSIKLKEGTLLKNIDLNDFDELLSF